MTKTNQPTTREAVAVFQSEADMQAAIDDLLTHGFDRAEISLLASTQAIEAKLGHRFEPLSQIEDDPEIPRIAYVSTETIGDAKGAVIGGLIYVGALGLLVPVVASGGSLAAALVAMSIGGGGGAAIGGLLARLIGKQHGEYIESKLRHGGLVLWVRTWNQGDEDIALKILQAHSGEDVHMHGLPEIHPILEDRYLGAISDAEKEAYQDETYVKAGNGEYYAFGKLFANEEDTKAYIDRHAYLETLHSVAKAQSFDLHAAMIDPSSQFDTPANLAASGLPKSIKLELLKRWVYEVKELQIASDDGMPAPSDENLLPDLEQMIVQLES